MSAGDLPPKLSIFALVGVGEALVLNAADLAQVSLARQDQQRPLDGMEPAARKIKIYFRWRAIDESQRAHDPSHRQPLQQQRGADHSERHRLEDVSLGKRLAIRDS